MRPKSPFLQNLRKKTPQPQMKQRGKGGTDDTGVPKPVERGFQPYMWIKELHRSSERSFETFDIQPEPEAEAEALLNLKSILRLKSVRHMSKDMPKPKRVSTIQVRG